MKQKTSPIKHPVFTKKRAASADFDQRCPDRVDDHPVTGARPGKRVATVDIPTVAKKPMVLREHSDKDRCDRVNKLVEADKATVGWFVEIFPADDQKLAPEDRWFAEVTQTKLVSLCEGKACRVMWCKVNTMTREIPIQNTQILLHHLKDYGPKSTFY